MSHIIRTFLLGGAAVCAGVPAGAQSPGNAAQVPAPAYRSAFEDYRPFAAEEVQDWRQANDTVRAVGGWRAYAREIHGQPATPAPAAAPQAAPPDTRRHQGHHP